MEHVNIENTAFRYGLYVIDYHNYKAYKPEETYINENGDFNVELKSMSDETHKILSGKFKMQNGEYLLDVEYTLWNPVVKFENNDLKSSQYKELEPGKYYYPADSGRSTLRPNFTGPNNSCTFYSGIDNHNNNFRISFCDK